MKETKEKFKSLLGIVLITSMLLVVGSIIRWMFVPGGWRMVLISFFLLVAVCGQYLKWD